MIVNMKSINLTKNGIYINFESTVNRNDRFNSDLIAMSVVLSSHR